MRELAFLLDIERSPLIFGIQSLEPQVLWVFDIYFSILFRFPRSLQSSALFERQVPDLGSGSRVVPLSLRAPGAATFSLKRLRPRRLNLAEPFPIPTLTARVNCSPPPPPS